MPNQDLTIFTNLREEPSGGASLMSFEPRWVQSLYPIGMTVGELQTLPNNSFGSFVTADGGSLRLVWADQSTESAARVDATVTIFANQSDPHQFENALYRGLSLLILSHIRDDFIKETFQSLSEIYQWQIDSEKIVPLEPQIVDFGSTPLQRIERQPFQHR
jgi:hypothetical protein